MPVFHIEERITLRTSDDILNRNDNAILTAIIENEVDASQLERVEQLQGLGIFAADIREYGGRVTAS